MELSACIVVYNGADEALRAAQTVLDCTRRHPLTLYLVDNADFIVAQTDRWRNARLLTRICSWVIIK